MTKQSYLRGVSFAVPNDEGAFDVYTGEGALVLRSANIKIYYNPSDMIATAELKMCVNVVRSEEEMKQLIKHV